MTSKEALERLKFILDKELNTGSKSYEDLQEFWNYKEPLKVIEELIERDTPMIPIYESIELICPKCREGQHKNPIKTKTNEELEKDKIEYYTKYWK